jgi:hypothetical protein
VQLEGLGQLKKSNDLPACSIVPQPTTLPHAPSRHVNGVLKNKQHYSQVYGLLDYDTADAYQVSE